MKLAYTLTLTLALALALALSAQAQDSAQCEGNGFSLSNLYTAFQASGNKYMSASLPSGGSLVYAPCTAVPYSTCPRGTMVGQVSSDGSSCTNAGSGTPAWLFNPSGFTVKWGGASGDVTFIQFHCNATAGLGELKYASANPVGPGAVLDWSSQYVCA